MAKYNVPFININTFIYEPSYVEKPTTGDLEAFALISNGKYYHNLSQDITDPDGNKTSISSQINTLGISPKEYYSPFYDLTINGNAEIKNYVNGKFFESTSRLPTTASFFTALN